MIIEEKIIRQLARDFQWQILYGRAKELSGIYLFNNNRDFTKLQLSFLNWLELYNSLYIDIACDEEFIDNERIKDNILVDAYLVYKKRERERTKSKKPQPDKRPSDSIIFKKRRK